MLYRALAEHYGAQEWWPGDSDFEVMVGAILTQNTSWRNVEAALSNLRRAARLSFEGMVELTVPELAELIRPAGYFNLKARRLQNLCGFLSRHGGITALAAFDTSTLRRLLLDVNGIGPETADDILLYAFDRDVFVADSYAQRLFARIGITERELPYEALRHRVERELPGGAAVFGQFHALIVAHAKRHCRKVPLCEDCHCRTFCNLAGSVPRNKS